MKKRAFTQMVRQLYTQRLLIVACAALLLPFPMRAQARGRQMLHGHVPAIAARLSPVGSLPGTNRLNLAIGLPLRNREALTNLLRQIYDPASPNYHHYLTPKEFTERFGPTKKDYQTVIAFAKAQGLRVTATHPDRVLLDVNGSVADIEKALHVAMRVYQHPTEKRLFHAPDVEPSLDLAVPILSISGLDDYSLPRPRLQVAPLANTQKVSPNAGSGPSGTYMGKDFRAAYVPDSSLNGSGQMVGLLQFDGYNPSDITYYESQAGLPSVTLSNVLIDGATGTPSGSGGEVEVCLDIEMAISMATNLSKVVVYIAPNPSPWEDILSRMTYDTNSLGLPNVRQLSCSWYEPGAGAKPTCDQYFQTMAAQGQSFFNASGDYDAYTGLIDFPGDRPDITQVGGTTLTTSGPGGSWVSETVWNWGNGIGSGGGISTQYPIPSWQTNIDMTANQGSTTMRNTPDVALIADNVYVRADGGNYDVGGTSCSAPLWAGFAALVNQQAAATGKPTVGLINAAVDTIGSGANYTSAFHDITTGNNTWSGSPTKFYAVTGYDLCTGWGTPAGQKLVNALANPESLVITPANGFSSIGGAGGPFTITAQSLSLTNVGTNSLTWTLVNTSLWLDASPAGGTLTPGGPADIVTVSLNSVASNLVVGTYSATLWFTNLNSGVGQGRQYSLSVISPPTITAQPADQAVLDGATATFTVEATGGMPMYYQWQANGTNLTDGGSISGSTTTNLTISNVSVADVGTYSVIVSNIAGSANSSNAQLTITPSPPVIVSQPVSQTVVAGTIAQFSVAAWGNKPFFYQWTFDGTNITDATNATLALANVQLTQAGVYAVVVSNAYGSTLSSNAILTVVNVPIITSFAPVTGSAGTSVAINGANFSPVVTNNIIYFGAVQATVTAASETNLTVTVPVGATYAPITETVDGLTAWADAPFVVTFLSGGTLDLSSLAPRVNLGAGSGPFAVAIGDLDRDGKADLVVANAYDGTVWIYRNISTNGALTTGSFAPAVVLLVGGGRDSLMGLALADLDGDGRLDIVVANYNHNNVSVFQNLCVPGSITTNSFGVRVDLPVGVQPVSVAARDLDGDGRPEIITANIGDSTVSVLQNLGAGGGIITTNSFAPAVNFVAATGPSCVVVADLDGDGKPDLATANHSDSSSIASVWRNVSTPGSISSNSFASRVDISGPVDQSETVAIGDLDGDGKADLVVGSHVGQAVLVYRNIGTPGSLDTNSFAPAVSFALGGRVHRGGIAIGDLDGDGKPEVAAATEEASLLSLYRNVSVPGSFTTNSLGPRLDFSTGYNAAGVAIGDLDGDGRPDIVFCNTYDNTVSICRNIVPIGAVPPSITTQPTNQTVVAGQTATFTVGASGTPPLSYQWNFNGTDISGATNPTLTLANVQFSQAGNYAVSVTNLYGSILSSNALLTITLDHFAWSQIPSPQFVNTPFAVTIQAQDMTNGLFTNFSGTVSLRASSGGGGSMIEDFESGIWPHAPWVSLGVVGTISSAYAHDGNYGLQDPDWTYRTDVSLGNAGNRLSWWVRPGSGRAYLGFGASSSGCWSAVAAPNTSQFIIQHNSGYGFADIVSASQDWQAGKWYKVTVVFTSTSSVTCNLYDSDGTTLLNSLTYNNVTGLPGGVAIRSINGFSLDTIGSGIPGGDVPISPTNSGNFVNGVWNGNITVLGRATNAVLTADDGNNHTGSSNPFDVVPSNMPPVILAQPTNQTVVVGGTASFSVTASGTPPLSYQWCFNGTNILGATDPTLTLADVQLSQAGNYAVLVTNLYGSTSSANALLTVSLPPTNCVTAPSGLVSWWPAEGNANDVIGTNNGTPVDVTYTNGMVGQAFKLNGASAYVQVADPSGQLNFDVRSNDFTVACWVNLASLSQRQNFIMDRATLLNQPCSYDIFFHATLGKFVIDCWDGTVNVEIPSVTSPATNTWYYVAMVCRSRTLQLYVNGNPEMGPPVDSGTPETIPANYGSTRNTEGARTIGRFAGGFYGDYTRGLLDEVQIFRRALTSNEIAAIYNAGSSGECPPAPTPPVITGFNPSAGVPGTVVNVLGANFSPVISNNIVYFGAVQATVTAASTTNLTVPVPVGATYAPITETVNGLTAWADAPFVVTFSSGGTLDLSSLAPRVNLGAGSGPFAVAIGDLDRDGKADLVVANAYDATVWVYRNISTNGALTTGSFAPPVVLSVGGGRDSLMGLALADLEGDGRLDIVVANRNRNNVSVYQNLCTPGDITTNSFGARVDLPVGVQPVSVAARDLDGDGRPEIITANVGDSTVSVLQNLGAGGGIITTNSFAPAVNFVAATGPSCVVVADLDGDGKPDLATANESDSSSIASVWRNVSTPGSISSNSFASRVDISGPVDQSETVAIGDLDGDGKADLVVGSHVGQAVLVYRNIGTPGSLDTNSFASAVSFALGGRVHRGGIAIGDLDGDGKPDVAAATEQNSLLSLYRNVSVPGSFTTNSLGPRLDFSTGNNAAGVAIGDLDGDGRPDIVFCNSYSDTISIYRNIVPFGAVPPSITTQPTNQTVVAGQTATFTVGASGTPLLSYQWKFNGTNLLQATNSTLTLTNVQFNQGGNYTVLVTNLYGSILSSNALLTVLAPPFITVQPTNQTVVVGGTASFSVTASGTPPLSYQWCFNGTNILGATDPTLTLADVQLSQAGNYAVLVTNLYGSTSSANALLTVSLPPTNCVTAPSGLVSWWPGEGNAEDIVGTNNGILSSGVAFASGKVNQAFFLDSTNAYFRVPASSSLNVGLGSGLTVEGWINISNVNGLHPICEWNDGINTIGVQFWVGANPSSQGVLYTTFLETNGNNFVQVASPSGTLVANTFQHVAVTYDHTSGYINLYVNGQMVANHQWGSHTPLTSYDLWVGRRPQDCGGGCWTDGTYLGGLLDELSLYNRALTSNEIAAIYLAGSGGKCPPAAAPPVITGFNPSAGVPGTVVNVLGANFSPVISNNIVYFGAVQATVTAASETNLTVTVPVGATYAPITETVDGLTAWADAPFVVTFSSGGTLDLSSLAPRVDLDAGSGPFAVAIGDLDRDGKADLVVANAYDGTVWVYRNISTNGALTTGSFAPAVVLLVGGGRDSLMGLALADLDGDGRLDIVVANRNHNNVSVYQNLCTPGDITTNSFGVRVDLPVGVQPVSVAARDLDGDGRPEIVTANIGDSTVSVLQNLGAGGGIISSNSFAPAVNFVAATGPSCVVVADLDGDGKPDLATANESDSSSIASVWRNVSTPGSISSNSFASRVDISGPVDQSETVAIGDLDGDGKADLVVGSHVGQAVLVYRNIGTPDSLDTNSFASAVSFALPGRVHRGGIAIGDLDGDGKPDVAAATEENSLSLYRNISVPGSFTTNSLGPRLDFSTGNNAADVAIGDLDGDGRPDIVFCNSYSDTISIYRNIVPFGAVPPSITTQPTNQTVVAGQTAIFAVGASGTLPLSYQWEFNGTNLDGATNTTLTLNDVQFNQGGNYTVLVTNLYGSTNSANAVLTVNPPPCDPAPLGLVSWWPGEGNANDIVGGNNGMLSNGVVFVGGMVGQAFSFNGSNSYVQVPDAPSLQLTNELTIEFWVRRQQLATEDYLVNKGGDWTAGMLNYGVTIPGANFSAASNSLTLNFAGGTRHSSSITDFNWHHCAVVARNGDADPTFYIDGVQQPIILREGSSTLNLYPSTQPLQIGAQVDPATGFNYYSKALVDELSIYDRALSSNEIAAIYNAWSAGKCVTSPTILQQPVSQAVLLGCDATFNVFARGTKPLSYQWWKDGLALDLQTNKSLTLTNIQTSDFGSYSVVITNLFGSVTSSPALLALGHPPVANADTVYRFAAGGVRVNVSGLLANDTDPDGDALTLIEVSSNSVLGGTVGLTNNWIYYAPPAGSTNGDTFTYVVSDGHCGTDVGTVTVQVKADNPLPLTFAIANPGDGSIHLTFDGIPGYNYRIEYTEDLSNPVWQTLTTQTADGFGVCQFVDWSLTNAPARFYRAVWP